MHALFPRFDKKSHSPKNRGQNSTLSYGGIPWDSPRNQGKIFQTKTFDFHECFFFYIKNLQNENLEKKKKTVQPLGESHGIPPMEGVKFDLYFWGNEIFFNTRAHTYVQCKDDKKHIEHTIKNISNIPNANQASEALISSMRTWIFKSSEQISEGIGSFSMA